MNTIQSELSRLAKEHPAFNEILEGAKKNISEQFEAQKDAEAEQERQEEIQKAQDKLDAESKLLSTNFIYSFVYSPEPYAAKYNIILATSQEEAEKKAWDFLREEQRKHKITQYNNWEDLDKVFGSVDKIDVTDGVMEIGYYYE